MTSLTSIKHNSTNAAQTLFFKLNTMKAVLKDTDKCRQQLISILPKALKPSLKLIPFTLQKKLTLPIMHTVFSEALNDDDFECLEDKWLKLSINDLDIHWLFSVKNKKFIMQSAHKNTPAEVNFSANGNDLLLIAARQEDPDTLFFQRRLLIEGDTALGLEIKNLIDSIDTSEMPDLFNKALQTGAKWLAPDYTKR